MINMIKINYMIKKSLGILSIMLVLLILGVPAFAADGSVVSCKGCYFKEGSLVAKTKTGGAILSGILAVSINAQNATIRIPRNVKILYIHGLDKLRVSFKEPRCYDEYSVLGQATLIVDTRVGEIPPEQARPICDVNDYIMVDMTNGRMTVSGDQASISLNGFRVVYNTFSLTNY